MPSEIAHAGNTVVPALLALEALGYEISIQGDLVTAAAPDGRFVAADPVSVLGLVKLVEARSWNWRPVTTRSTQRWVATAWAPDPPNVGYALCAASA